MSQRIGFRLYITTTHRKVDFHYLPYYNSGMNNQKRAMRTANETIGNRRKILNTNYIHLTSKILKDIIAEDEKLLNKIKQELSLLAEGNLHIHNKGGVYTFGCSNDKQSKELGITSDMDMVHDLARRNVLEIRRKCIEERKGRLIRISNNYENAIYEQRIMQKLGRYADAGLDLCQILFTKEQNEWINALYSPNPFHRENLNFETDGGIVMRSKSEVLLGNALEAIGWPYRSDDLVKIEDSIGAIDQRSGQPFRDTYFADIKAPNLLGGITVHEHLGAFQLERYGENALQRLNDYHNFTIEEIPGRPVEDFEFTWSFESDLRTKEGIKKVIRRILLPKF